MSSVVFRSGYSVRALQEYDQLVFNLSSVERSIFDACKAQLMGIDNWPRNVQQSIFLLWIDKLESTYPQLRGDPFGRYSSLRKDLENTVSKKNNLVREKVVEDINSGSTRSILISYSNHPKQTWEKFDHELSKTRRVKPMRVLFEEYRDIVKQIAPCWLLSPEMLSRVIPLERGFFDLVVFDEASQLNVERSLPAIFRAKRVVIAGDEKQLPPFDLFNIQNEEESEEEEADSAEIKSAESLLMLARRVYSYRYLSWHYRSQSQELIEFSNRAFYEGLLLVANNIFKRSPETAIRWISCDGIWEDRKNPVEAERVVDEISKIMIEADSNKIPSSIGVVTFNDAQRDQILTSISVRKEKDPLFGKLYSRTESSSKTNPDQKIFVKNIENVQGDERDYIIFSVGYSRDPLGTGISIRFGALNREGGENRLNVAITRARKEILVCCSFNPEDLQAERSRREGPKLLKAYLQYAKAVSERNDSQIKDILTKLAQKPFERKAEGQELNFESPLEEQVYDALIQLGFTVDSQVGYSNYRIDLAVAHPKNLDRYLLAIECDGAMFHSAKSSRERDLVRQRFLESRGWIVERVWSRNWWRDRNGELDRLRSRIDKESLQTPLLIRK